MAEFGLIGYPLGHSFSKTYFLEKFKSEKLNHQFELFPIETIDDFPSLISKYSALKGIAVTIPYKESVISYLDAVSKEAEEIGAVNCICFQDGKLKGFNTDVIGFEKSFVPELRSFNKKALILGTGGSSRAVQFVLAKIGIEFKLVSRSKSDLDSTINYADLDEKVMNQFTVIINCTPSGMYPKETEKPDLPYTFISDQHYLFDLVYKPAETLFLKEGKSRGARIKNGFEMLVLQAEENWNLWQATL